ncbi:unnamed protein product [Schistosoma curassoni]|uniref:ATPase_AAA_core domain-containing protein n=1 Tax=Schistosoma curassoni TaxID=6186 RepID=A0A183JFQ9_9TREM|nr:unnamed protein product [Schistosoma curassoni]
MLKLLEGSLVNVPDVKSPRKLLDTTNILFIACGAFNGLDKIISRRKHKKTIGFDMLTSLNESTTQDNYTSSVNPNTTDFVNLFQSFESSAHEENAERDKLLQEVEANDLITYGMIPEFVGRFPIITALHSLNEEMLVRVLTEPRNALIKQYQLLFNIDGVSVSFIITIMFNNCGSRLVNMMIFSMGLERLLNFIEIINLSKTTIENLKVVNGHFVLVWDSLEIRIHNPPTWNRTHDLQSCLRTPNL